MTISKTGKKRKNRDSVGVNFYFTFQGQVDVKSCKIIK